MSPRPVRTPPSDPLAGAADALLLALAGGGFAWMIGQASAHRSVSTYVCANFWATTTPGVVTGLAASVLGGVGYALSRRRARGFLAPALRWIATLAVLLLGGLVFREHLALQKLCVTQNQTITEALSANDGEDAARNMKTRQELLTTATAVLGGTDTSFSRAMAEGILEEARSRVGQGLASVPLRPPPGPDDPNGHDPVDQGLGQRADVPPLTPDVVVSVTQEPSSPEDSPSEPRAGGLSFLEKLFGIACFTNALPLCGSIGGLAMAVFKRHGDVKLTESDARLLSNAVTRVAKAGTAHVTFSSEELAFENPKVEAVLDDIIQEMGTRNMIDPAVQTQVKAHIARIRRNEEQLLTALQACFTRLTALRRSQGQAADDTAWLGEAERACREVENGSKLSALDKRCAAAVLSREPDFIITPASVQERRSQWLRKLIRCDL